MIVYRVNLRYFVGQWKQLAFLVMTVVFATLFLLGVMSADGGRSERNAWWVIAASPIAVFLAVRWLVRPAAWVDMSGVSWTVQGGAKQALHRESIADARVRESRGITYLLISTYRGPLDDHPPEHQIPIRTKLSSAAEEARIRDLLGLA